ncbi:related to transcription activator amyR [Cephalotrichum gorgonifer]|uniref:Related to transcription activator amyR n=1 Tax=Cephalotrichum gorgonifer TaxID=2041049 RepID=A0AAE8SWT8_9PEZI|nr:related to transcription activator amyR [Cephalotrichum gorgonifer]
MDTPQQPNQNQNQNHNNNHNHNQGQDHPTSASGDGSVASPAPTPSLSSSTGGGKRPRSGTPNSDSVSQHRHLSPRPKRAQVTRACNRCKRLQKGCSEDRPCRRCVKADLAAECLNPSPRPVAAASSPLALGAVPGACAPPQGPCPSSATSSAFPFAPRTLPPPEVISHCVERFFVRLFPTIPILTEAYILGLRQRAENPDPSSPSSSSNYHESYGTLLAMCAMVTLQVEEPGAYSFGAAVREPNDVYGRHLFDEAIEAHRRVRQGSTPTFDHILLTFFIYACHSSLCHHSLAFFFLREATTLLLLYKPTGAAAGNPLADRLFWVLLISERSHAIRYRRPVTLQVTASTPPPSATDPSLAGFRDLAALFRPIDTSFIALLSHEMDPSFVPSAASLARVEAAINTAVDHTAPLRDTQKANLRVTQLWLRIILWQLRLRLGHLSDVTAPGGSTSLTYHYPLEVAREATLSTRDLPLAGVAVHGVGLTEKLFDVACAVVDVLARIPLTREAAELGGVGGEAQPEDNLRYLRRLIAVLPGGEAIYVDLLLKHVQLTLPGLVL